MDLMLRTTSPYCGYIMVLHLAFASVCYMLFHLISLVCYSYPCSSSVDAWRDECVKVSHIRNEHEWKVGAWSLAFLLRLANKLTCLAHYWNCFTWSLRVNSINTDNVLLILLEAVNHMWRGVSRKQVLISKSWPVGCGTEIQKNQYPRNICPKNSILSCLAL